MRKTTKFEVAAWVDSALYFGRQSFGKVFKGFVGNNGEAVDMIIVDTVAIKIYRKTKAAPNGLAVLPLGSRRSTILPFFLSAEK